MKIIGIIAEYNPFHNGHFYQIEKIRAETQADYLVIILSGDFVQRGTPALIDKYTRTQMALSCGADLVFELPTLWATASAEYFSAAGITLLDRLGIDTTVCFGSECDDIQLLSCLAKVLVKTPFTYQQELLRLLKEGYTFPAARMEALICYLKKKKHPLSQSEELRTVLSSPNNILAIEYLKELQRRNSSITPYPILRQGSGYHDTRLHTLASATAIRRAMAPCTNRYIPNSDIAAAALEKLRGTVPEAVAALLAEYIKRFPLLGEDTLSAILKYRLLTLSATGFDRFADCSLEISNRIAGNLPAFRSFSDFCQLLNSKEVTYSRISRILLHILLDIHQRDYSFGRELDYIPYLRVLGFRKSAAPLLGQIKERCPLPLLTKMADAGRILHEVYPADSFAHRMLALDIFAADIYTSMQTDLSKNITKNEYNHGLVLVP